MTSPGKEIDFESNDKFVNIPTRLTFRLKRDRALAISPLAGLMERILAAKPTESDEVPVIVAPLVLEDNRHVKREVH